MKRTKKLCLYGLIVPCGCLVISCSHKNLPSPPPVQVVVKYAVTAGSENLSALTKVTDGEDICTMPFGGDNGSDLFFIKKISDGTNTYSNIYKKENPLANASSEKTSGKNYNSHPSYCAAVDKLVFRYYSAGANSSDIYMMAASQGKALTQITDSRGEWEDNPSFSPNGQYIIYDKSPSGVNKRDGEIWIKNRETGENTLLGKGAQPSFSPDGQTIAYIKYSGTDADIFTMTIDGENQVQVTDSKKGFAQNPRWSPDGRFIIFSAIKDGKNSDIFVIRTDGEMLTQLTTNESTDAQPYWTTDGYIYFTSDRGGKQGNFQIWRFRYDHDTPAAPSAPTPAKTQVPTQLPVQANPEVQEVAPAKTTRTTPRRRGR